MLKRLKPQLLRDLRQRPVFSTSTVIRSLLEFSLLLSCLLLDLLFSLRKRTQELLQLLNKKKLKTLMLLEDLTKLDQMITSINGC